MLYSRSRIIAMPIPGVIEKSVVNRLAAIQSFSACFACFRCKVTISKIFS